MITFESIEQKVRDGSRLSADDGLFLFNYPDLLALARLAHSARLRLHGTTTYFNWNLHLNSTNVCEADCLFCSFSRLKTGMPKAYTMSLVEAERWIRELCSSATSSWCDNGTGRRIAWPVCRTACAG
jgi:aminodeoxyfutalosine synthase